MNINEILRSGANVQLVINALDLKELFLEWQAEVEANKVKEKEETYKRSEVIFSQTLPQNATGCHILIATP